MMIQVLRKAFDVLEHLARDPDRSFMLNDIARGTSLPVPTCGRILQTLLECDYIEQVQRRRGYRIGPMAYSLVGGGMHRKDLIRAAEPLLIDTAKRLKESIVLVILHRGRRYCLVEVDGGQAVAIRREVMAQNQIYQTATGRLLLAWLDPADRELAFSCNGDLSQTWPEAAKSGAQEKIFAGIRAQSHLVIHHQEDQVVHLAVPVREKGQVSAAIGVYVPAHRFVGEHRKRIIKELERIAAAIGDKLK